VFNQNMGLMYNNYGGYGVNPYVNPV